MAIAAWRKGVAEFVGAFTLIFIGAGAIISTGGTDLPLIALAHGLAIGLTSALDIMMGGPLTGAAMNPARWFGPAIVAQFFDNWYVYWIGPFIGAIVAGLLYANVFLEKPR